MATDLPKSLKKLAKETVISVLDKSLPVPDLTPLHNWFEKEKWDQIVMSNQGSCTYLDTIASDLFNDESIKEHSDSDDVEITDELRISFGRQFIESKLEQSEDSLHAVEMEVPSLPSVFIDCFVIGQGQGGWKLVWGAAYRSVKELVESYGDMIIGDSASVSDDEILQRWHRG